MIETEAAAVIGTEAKARTGSEEEVVHAVPAPPAPAARGSGRSRELESLTSGFGDGDTALGPITKARRSA